jgi:hypothetical protein
MGYKVEFKHPYYEKGVEFEIAGLGLIANGGSINVDADQERSFIATQGKTLKDALQGNGMLSLSGTSELKKEEVEALLPPPPPPEPEPATDEQAPGNVVGRENTPGGGE